MISLVTHAYKLVLKYYLHHVLFWGWGMGMDPLWKVQNY